MHLKVAYLVLQDEKAQLLITYLWLHYVSAITHVNTSVIWHDCSLTMVLSF